MAQNLREHKNLRCKHQYCLFKTPNQMLLGLHEKHNCIFLKPTFPKDGNKSRTRNDFSQLDLRYALRGPHIHTGGYGAVYNARLGPLRMAMKEPRDFNSTQTSALTKEASILKDIHKQRYQPGFPRIFGCLPQTGPIKRMFIEKLDCTLGEYMVNVWGQIGAKGKASMVYQMLQRLKTIHKMGYVHRDLKLNNFMVKENEIYLIDFGCALYLPSCTQNSVFGHLRHLHSKAHLDVPPRYHDDLEMLCWMLIDSISNHFLPWKDICAQVDAKQLKYHDVWAKVGQLKDNWLVQMRGKIHSSSKFIFQMIYAIRDDESKQFPLELYSKLEDILVKTINDKNIPGQAYAWKKTSLLYPIHPDDHFGIILDAIPKFPAGTFMVEILPIQLFKPYKEKQPLSYQLIENTMRSFLNIQVLDLSKPQSESKIEGFRKRNEYSTMVLCHYTHCFVKHVQLYIVLGPYRMISFNGLTDYKTTMFQKFGKVEQWREVEWHTQDWEEGYRVLFWMMHIAGIGQYKWLIEKGLARPIEETKTESMKVQVGEKPVSNIPNQPVTFGKHQIRNEVVGQPKSTLNNGKVKQAKKNNLKKRKPHPSSPKELPTPKTKQIKKKLVNRNK